MPGAIGVVDVRWSVAVYPRRRLKRLDAEYGERSAKWRAFERWTKDFPTLKDDPPATLELWKRILVFGVAFGTAERMIESGRIPAPVMESCQRRLERLLLPRAAVTHRAFDGSAFGSGFASQVAPESSSGGGGGFSGRRRWRGRRGGSW